VVDLAVDYKNNVIYWNEHVTKTLKKASLSDPTSATVLVSSDIGTPEGLTLDWVRGRLYWVDDTKGTVEVVNTDGTDRRVLKSGLSRPRDIVVNPLEEALYFTVWGTAPGIAKLNTDGSGFTVLVNDSIAWPNGIALDLPGERLYWVDGRHKVIESIKTDGTGRIIVKALSSGQHPYSIAVFENLMFVSDFVEQRVIVFDRFTGEEVRSFSRNTSSVTGVFISQEALQPPSTLCRRPELPYYDTSQFKTPTYKIGDVLTIRCEGQSKLNGSNIVKCGHDGRWFPTLPVCQPLSPTTGTPTTVQTPTPMGQQGVDKRGAKFEGASFGIGFAIGCISLIVIIVILTIIAVILCKRYQTSIRPVGSINFTNPYYKKSSEAVSKSTHCLIII
jgi:DNA-binding beta-propeller fold protein YncE